MNINSIRNRQVLVVGDLIVDTYHLGTVSRVSPEAPIPVVRVTDSYSVLGGAANVARNLKELHCIPIVLGVCGHDSNGEKMKRMFDEAHIKHHLIECEYPTITKTRIVGNRQQIVRVDFENDKMKISEQVYNRIFEIIKNIINAVDIVVISDYGKGFCNDTLCRFLIEISKNNKKIVIVDPKGKDWYKYGNATFITPNLKELSDISGNNVPNYEKDIIEEARSVSNQFKIDNILVTRSEKGMTLVSQDIVYNLPTKAREVFDVSGAGDTVVATLAASLAAGNNIRESVSLANEAAGIVVGKAGTQPIFFEELTMADTFLNNNKLVSLDRLQDLLIILKNKKKRIVFTNGCFDVLHYGHVSYLQKAKSIGDILIVGLNSDKSVKRLKGENRPINDEIARATVLSALKCIDFVVIFEEDTPLNLIKSIRPDVLVKGADYRVEEVVGREFAGEVKLIEFVNGYSSTGIINKL